MVSPGCPYCESTAFEFNCGNIRDDDGKLVFEIVVQCVRCRNLYTISTESLNITITEIKNYSEGNVA